MTTVAAPTLFDAIDAVAPVVREYADESERIARLAEPVVAAMKEHRLFKGLAPRTLDGYEIDPVGWYSAVEAAARVDGSFGWIMFINGASGLGGQSMPPELSEEMIRDKGSVGAGSVFPFGKAVATEGGYIANGRWTYASGIRHADTVFGFATIFDGDTPRMLMPGTPAVAIVNTPTSNVEILPSWDVCGLSGTGSNDFIMKDLFVPESQVSILGMPAPANHHYAGPLYRLPFMTLFAQPIGAVALGIAQHAIDEVLELAKTKSPAAVGPAAPLRERPMFHAQLAEAVAYVNSARAWLHAKIGEQFELAQAGQSPDLNQRVETQLATSNATRSAYKAVEIMYLAGGGTSNFRKSPLQRCMRDIHAVTQHAATNPSTWEFTGATMAGMPLQNPLILL
ncbi:MAG: acyl-CoA dehydrogenase family protein [Dehalococcoidia bacterium]